MQVGTEGAAGAPLDEVFRKDCPGRPVFEQVTGRWGLLILVALSEGALRFAQLRDRVGRISEKMLAQNLRTLVRNGLTERTVEPTVPPRVTYALTPLGRDLVARLRPLVEWSAEHDAEIAAAQRRHDDGVAAPMP
ncbi:winged helix-turn-helix transcriptional regulator [Nocardia sp. NPDC057227]|uniref:winged helix-turn-helix transcriptional regulator n=1 Tax=Nocardia sp. NPDC057227 TaxID=3346056 RepID=UPI00362E1B65